MERTPEARCGVSGQELLVQRLNKDHKITKVVLGHPPASPILQVTSLLLRLAGHCWPGSQGYCMWDSEAWGARGRELYNQREPAEGEGCACTLCGVALRGLDGVEWVAMRSVGGEQGLFKYIIRCS